MKVQEYRELIDAVGDQIRSVQSAATPQEKQREKDSLKRWIGRLEGASSNRANYRDIQMAQNILLRAKTFIS